MVKLTLSTRLSHREISAVRTAGLRVVETPQMMGCLVSVPSRKAFDEALEVLVSEGYMVAVKVLNMAYASAERNEKQLPLADCLMVTFKSGEELFGEPVSEHKIEQVYSLLSALCGAMERWGGVYHGNYAFTTRRSIAFLRYALESLELHEAAEVVRSHLDCIALVKSEPKPKSLYPLVITARLGATSLWSHHWLTNKLAAHGYYSESTLQINTGEHITRIVVKSQEAAREIELMAYRAGALAGAQSVEKAFTNRLTTSQTVGYLTMEGEVLARWRASRV